MWGFPPFQYKLLSCGQLTFSSNATKKTMLPFSCLIAHKSQGKSCTSSTAGNHCSAQVDRKATAWKAEKVIVPHIGRPGKEMMGCHTSRHSTQCALQAQGNGVETTEQFLPHGSSFHALWHPTSGRSFNTVDGRLLLFNHKMLHFRNIKADSDFFKAPAYVTTTFWVAIEGDLKLHNCTKK